MSGSNPSKIDPKTVPQEWRGLLVDPAKHNTFEALIELLGEIHTWTATNCLTAWAMCHGDFKPSSAYEFGLMTLFTMQFEHLLRELRVRARRLDLNAKPINDIIAVTGSLPLTMALKVKNKEANPEPLPVDFGIALRFAAFISEIEDEERAKGVPAAPAAPAAATIAPRQAPPIPSTPIVPSFKPDPVDTAIGLLTRHPEWSDRKIAEAAGCNPWTLSRSDRYKAVRRVFVGELPPRGSKDGETGEIESFDDSLDSSNRRRGFRN